MSLRVTIRLPIGLTTLKSVIHSRQILTLVAIVHRSIHNSVGVPLFMHNAGLEGVVVLE